MITVNKRHNVDWHPEMTVRELLKTMKYTFPHIIVSIDGKLVRHDTYDNTLIPDGADVRVIHLIAGG